MSKLGNIQKRTAADVQILTGNGVLSSFTLNRKPASVNSILVSVGGVFLNTTDFSVNGFIITFTDVIPNGVQIAVYHLGDRRIVNSLEDSGVTAGVYGTESLTPRLQIGADGRVISSVEVEMRYPRGYVSGFVGARNETAPSSFVIGGGAVRSDTDTTNINSSSFFYKSFSSWTQGVGSSVSPVGSLDTGTVINSRWYYAFVIKNPTTGAVDILTSLSPTSPVMPTGFTEKRLVWCFYLDVVGIGIKQFESAGTGDTIRVEWTTKGPDINQTNDSFTAGVNKTYSILAPGIKNVATLYGFVSDSTVEFGVYISSTLGANESISDANGRVMALSKTTGAARFNVDVLNAGAIYIGIEATTSVDSVKISTIGYTWFR